MQISAKPGQAMRPVRIRFPLRSLAAGPDTYPPHSAERVPVHLASSWQHLARIRADNSASGRR